jgi:hypothetical protein
LLVLGAISPTAEDGIPYCGVSGYGDDVGKEIMVHYQKHWLGKLETPELVVHAYDVMAVEYF